MGISCSKQRPQQAQPQVAKSHDFQILLDQQQRYSLEPEEEIKDQKQTKIDVAQNSIDLNKKRYSSKDVSILSKYIENELKNQSVRLERLTIDMRDPSLSVKGAQVTKCKEFSQEFYDQDESHVCYTVYTNPKYKRLKNMNEHTMSLLHLNENKSYYDLLYRVVNDYHFILEHEQEFNDILMRSQDSFLQNLLITDKYINEYGIFHIIKESFKFSKLELILQNDFTLNSTKFHYNKLFVEITYFPLLLATKHFEMICIEFSEKIQSFKQLTNSNFELIKFINQIKMLLNMDIQFLSISERNNNFLLSIIINDTQSKKIIQQINQSLYQKLGFLRCFSQPLVKYIGCQLCDIDPWNNREFKDETKADSQFSLQFGWKLFGLNIPQQNIFNIGFIYYNPNLSYSEKVRIYSFNELIKNSHLFDLIEIKVYCEKKYYKMLFQITYQDEDIMTENNAAYLTTLMNSRLTGILVYDADKQMKC